MITHILEWSLVDDVILLDLELPLIHQHLLILYLDVPLGNVLKGVCSLTLHVCNIHYILLLNRFGSIVFLLMRTFAQRYSFLGHVRQFGRSANGRSLLLLLLLDVY